jgi:hypothetical protein
VKGNHGGYIMVTHKHGDCFLNQILFKTKCEIEDKKNEFIEALKELYPINRKVECKRGNGKSICSIFSYGFGSYYDYITVKNLKTGKNHSYYYKDIKSLEES